MVTISYFIPLQNLHRVIVPPRTYDNMEQTRVHGCAGDPMLGDFWGEINLTLKDDIRPLFLWFSPTVCECGFVYDHSSSCPTQFLSMENGAWKDSNWSGLSKRWKLKLAIAFHSFSWGSQLSFYCWTFPSIVKLSPYGSRRASCRTMYTPSKLLCWGCTRNIFKNDPSYLCMCSFIYSLVLIVSHIHSLLVCKKHCTYTTQYCIYYLIAF